MDIPKIISARLKTMGITQKNLADNDTYAGKLAELDNGKYSFILPDGRNRRMASRLFKVDEAGFFGLLMSMLGADFIGAINF